MKPREIKDWLEKKLGTELQWGEGEKGTGDPWTIVPAEKWVEACRLLRESEQTRFDFLRSLCGTDRPDENSIEVVAHLFSYKHRHAFVLKTLCPRDGGELDSISGVWPAAEWYEREIFDLLGVNFRGHRDMRRLLMPDDWPGHPLRKDYTQPAEYHGIPTKRPQPGE
ncbi:MAG: NADH-quinone oxidoreductase subunit C [Deltaproteobacteria bacterium]|nr:MAG: NADH-quinone oxidoreductase subunit C [Deltaproteobacteria bacterium]